MLSIYNPDASVVQASGAVQLEANPRVAGPRLPHRKSTRRAVTPMVSIDLVAGEDHLVGRVAFGITGKLAGEAR